MENYRAGKHSDKQPNYSIVIRGVGDIMVIAGAARALVQNGYEYPFGQVAHFIRSADLAFGNLEMPISSNPKRKPNFPEVCPDFYSPALTAKALEFAGFDVLNLANNHMMDWGMEGLDETLSRLHDVGIQTIGAGRNLTEARRPAIFDHENRKIGLLGYSERGAWVATATQAGVAPLDRQMILEDIKSLRPIVELLIVSLHTGILSGYPSPEDRDLAHELIERGADLILGHGPHVTQGVETYLGKVIYFSMGNFMIDLASGNVENKTALQEHLESFMADVTWEPGKVTEARTIPIVIGKDFRTIPAGPEESARILDRLDRLSKNLPKMKGLALWEQAGELNVGHELRVLSFQGREVGMKVVLKRFTKIRWRHIRLLMGYIFSKVKHLFVPAHS
jgi:poly-gamma-glutamate capsule biosynthesis protein CapA/YwtB (metallophosphatase superfamily)